MLWALSQDKNKRDGDMGPCAAKQSRQQARLPDRQLGSAGQGRTRETMPKAWGCARLWLQRIVTEEGAGYTVRPCFPPPERYRNSMLPHGLRPPHTAGATVTRTGTPQPTCFGRGPTAVGQSVRVLPGNLQRDAARLAGKGSDLSLWGQSRCSSQRTGKPSTG